MDYHECLERLYAMQRQATPRGLDTMQAMLKLLDNPQKNYKTVHVAGTNGKGSCVHKIAAGLQHDGYKVGMFTSPHIASFCERIVVNSEMILEESVLFWMKKLFTLAALHGLTLTFFEYATLLGFCYFSEQKVDYAVIETGLGGRLDATNTIEPVCSIITTVSLDHTEILGSSETEIAFEKAGILKPGVPCVIGPQAKLEVIIARAKTLCCPVIQVPAAGSDYEVENRAIANLAMQQLQLSDGSIAEGLEAKAPCRFQKVMYKNSCEVILDVAHNPAGIRKLFDKIPEPVCVVAGFSADKDVGECLEILKKRSENLFFVRGQNPKAVDPKSLCNRAGVGQGFDLFDEAMRQALNTASQKGQRLVICGTFYIMSQACRFLGCG